jgi:hypothetical protein
MGERLLSRRDRLIVARQNDYLSPNQVEIISSEASRKKMSVF